MSCADLARHELPCRHITPGGGPGWRVRFADGCQIHVCENCFFTTTDDVVMVAAVDRNGIPLSREAWTEGDMMAALIVGTT